MSKVKIKLADLPTLSDAERNELEALNRIPLDRVDLSDIPELTQAQIASMEAGRFYKPVKQQITARLDADVLHWLKSQGKGYQTRMNAILRDAMRRSNN